VGRRCGLDSSGSGGGPVTGSCEHGNESWSSIKGGKFLDCLSDCTMEFVSLLLNNELL
jgi:hypothetical protein